jgi:hypothetical protein
MKTWAAGSILEGWQPKYALPDGMKNLHIEFDKILSAR